MKPCDSGLSVFLLIFCCSQSCSSFQLFDELDMRIWCANTTWRDPAGKAPDLYVQIDVSAKRPNGSVNYDAEVMYAKTHVHMKDFSPHFNQSFPYVRYERIRYTLGTDNVMRFKLKEQAPAYDPDYVLGMFELDLKQLSAEEPDEERIRVQEFQSTDGVTSSFMSYSVYFKMHEKGRKAGVGVDDYEADLSDSPMFHVHRVRHEDGTVDLVTPDYEFAYKTDHTFEPEFS